MKPYEHADPSGADILLTIQPNGAERVRVRIDDCDGQHSAYLEPSAVPAAALALYEAAGLPEPLILPRVMPPLGGPWRPEKGAALWAARVRAGNAPGEVRVGWGGAGPYEDMTPAKAREMAAVLAALADEADAEPDLAEVDELAEVIRAGLYPPSKEIGLRPDDADRAAARAVLLAGWKREPGSDR
jgi:hypothetical protein